MTRLSVRFHQGNRDITDDCFDFIQSFQHRLDLAEIELPCVGQADVTTCPVEKPGTDPPLQVMSMLAGHRCR